jgi:hypothetical protein
MDTAAIRGWQRTAVDTVRVQPASTWLFHPVVDVACVGSLTYLVFLPVLILNFTAPAPQVLGTMMILGNVLVNCPHYAATYYRVYRDKNEIQKYSFEAIWVPAVLLLLAVACFMFPGGVTPWVAFLYLATSGYHYSGQTYGVSMIFIGKSGLRLTPGHKRLLQLPIYSSYLYTLVALNVAGREHRRVLDTVVPHLNVPEAALYLCTMLVIVSVGLFVALNAMAYRQHGRVLPLVANVSVGAHVVWFTMLQFPVLMAVVPFLHCLQYLFVTVFFDFKEQRGRMRPDLSPARYFASSLFAKYYATQVAVGVAIFVVSPALLSGMGLASKALAGAVVISIFNLHHFILDGAIWKLRQPAVAKPLLT